MEIRARQHIVHNTKSPHRKTESDDDPPVNEHPGKALDKISEKEKKAEFDGAYAGPQQYDDGGDPFLEIECIFEHTERDGVMDDGRLHQQSFDGIHLADGVEEDAHGTYRAPDAKQQEAIIYAEPFLRSDPDVETGSSSDQKEDEQGYRGRLEIMGSALPDPALASRYTDDEGLFVDSTSVVV